MGRELKAFRYEHRLSRPLSRGDFAQRMLLHGGLAVLLVAVSLGIGTLGYSVFAHQTTIDAFLNAAMLLGGMGPVGAIEGTAGKLFAACFALYAGLIFLIIAGLLLAPAFHRVLHRFHFASEDSSAE